MKPVITRLLDQAAWSSAFFLANIWTALLLSVDSFAASTIASTAGVIGAAVVRAYAVDSRLVSRSRDGLATKAWFSSWVSLKASATAAISAFVFVVIWYSLAGGLDQYWTYGLIAVFIVVADIPHYSLIIRGQQIRALALAIVYAMVMGFGWILARNSPIQIWCLSLLIVTAVGWMFIGRLRSDLESEKLRGTAVRMAAESLYSAIGGQLGILILYLVAASAATAGIRLTYSLVFAPIFMVIQSLFPLVLRRITSVDGNSLNVAKRILIIWVLGCTSGLAMFAFGAWALGNANTTFSDTLVLTFPFLLPVGASMLGSLVLDAGLMRWRLTTIPSKPHFARLVLTLIDFLLQVSLVLTLGLEGVILGLSSGGLIKLVFGVLLLTRRGQSSILSAKVVSIET